MISSYIRMSLRILKRQGLYSFINIFGLSVGIACFILLAMYINHELSYEKGQQNADKIYRVVHTRKWDGNERKQANTPVPLGAALKEYIPGVEHTVRFWRSFGPKLKNGDRGFTGEKVYFTDPSVFDMFTFTFLTGNPTTALDDPNTVVLTRTLAEKLFGMDDPVGKSFEYKGFPDDRLILTVSGVIEDLPGNTHMDVDALVSLTGVKTEINNWGSIKPVWVYMMLPEEMEPAVVEEQFPAFVEEYLKRGWSEIDFQFRLEPVHDIHLHSEYSGGFKPGSNISRIYILAAVGLLILMIACINFMNLSTSLSQRRGREIGMRKVLGTTDSQIIRHFLAETVAYCAIAGILGAVIAGFFLNAFNTFSGMNFQYADMFDPQVIVILSLIIVASGLLSGAYPAFYLSSFKPADVLQKKFQFRATAMFVRKGLVVLQFIISIVLIICTLSINSQLKYMQQKDLGFNRDNIIVVPYAGNGKAFMNEISRNSDIAEVTVSTRIPANAMNMDRRPVIPEGKESPVQVESYIVDWNFLNTYQLQLAGGRDFSEMIPTDQAAFIINESAVKFFEWGETGDALGKEINYSNGDKTGPVIGVVEDFHMETLQSRIGPLIIQVMPDREYWKQYISIKTNGNDLPAVLNLIEQAWKKYAPEDIYTYFFLDESYHGMYTREAAFSSMFLYFASLSIIISCLGLFGLSLFTAENRTKEIGIRKTLGASTLKIVILLSKSVLVWIISAFVIACPVAAYITGKWLLNFAYRADFGVTVYLFAGLLTAVIAFITISFQSIKAASANPSKSLRYE